MDGSRPPQHTPMTIISLMYDHDKIIDYSVHGLRCGDLLAIGLPRTRFQLALPHSCTNADQLFKWHHYTWGVYIIDKEEKLQ